jgi:hypothetical protein
MVDATAPNATRYLPVAPHISNAVSANGAVDCAKVSGGIIPIITIKLNRYKTVVSKVPNSVAFGIVVSGDVIALLGTVALSIPKNAKNVRVVTAVISGSIEPVVNGKIKAFEKST